MEAAPITHAAVPVLRTMTGLRTLNLHRTKITNAAAMKLRGALPQCGVYWRDPTRR